jgi:hypothetical protein
MVDGLGTLAVREQPLRDIVTGVFASSRHKKVRVCVIASSRPSVKGSSPACQICLGTSEEALLPVQKRGQQGGPVSRPLLCGW